MFVSKFGEIDLSAARPLALNGRSNERFIVEQHFGIQIISKGMARRRSGNSDNRNVERAVAYLWQIEGRRYNIGYVQDYAWIPA